MRFCVEDTLMAKEIKPPPGFEWLEEDPPEDKWIP